MQKEKRFKVVELKLKLFHYVHFVFAVVVGVPLVIFNASVAPLFRKKRGKAREKLA